MEDSTKLIEKICLSVSKRMPNNALAPKDVQQKRFKELSNKYKLSSNLKKHITKNILGI